MSKNPVTYTSPEPVYVDGIYKNAGDPFTTTADPNDNWEKAKPVEKAAAQAADKTLDVQPSLEDFDIEALRALAATKQVMVKVDGKFLSKRDLIAAIKAADEPTL